MHFQISVRYFLNFKQVRDTFITSAKIKSLKGVDYSSLTENEYHKLNLEETSKEIIRLVFEIRTFGIITLTNAAMCLEGLINLYGAYKSSNSYFKNHLDKLDISTKWIVIPKLFADREIDKGSKMYENFKSLIKARNEMIHPKSSILTSKPDTNLPHLPNIVKQMTDLDKQFQSMLQMIIELSKIDPSFEPISVYSFLWDDNIKMPGFSDIESFKASIYTET